VADLVDRTLAAEVVFDPLDDPLLFVVERVARVREQHGPDPYAGTGSPLEFDDVIDERLNRVDRRLRGRQGTNTSPQSTGSVGQRARAKSPVEALSTNATLDRPGR